MLRINHVLIPATDNTFYFRYTRASCEGVLIKERRPGRMLVQSCLPKVYTLHNRWNGYLSIGKDGWRDIYIQSDIPDVALAARRLLGIVNDKWYPYRLLVAKPFPLQTMVTQTEAIVAHINDHGVIVNV